METAKIEALKQQAWQQVRVARAALKASRTVDDIAEAIARIAAARKGRREGNAQI